MKTLIVGSGIIGTIYGWALTQAGVDVTHFVRQGKKGDYKEGVRLDLLDERKGHPKHNICTYALKCVESISPTDGYQLIIVPTNIQQTNDALKQLIPCSGQAVFLIMSGNWEGTTCYDQMLPRNRYLLGYGDGGGTIKDGVYWTNLGSEIHLGAVDSQGTTNLEKVKALFLKADMQPDVQDDIVHWLWQHLAGVVGFAAGFAKHGNVQAYLADKSLMRECILSTKELYRLCEQRGVDLAKYPETSYRNWPVWLVALFLRWNFSHNESMQRYTAHAASTGSLREMKVCYDSMIRTAKELNVAMPYTEALGRYLQQVQ